MRAERRRSRGIVAAMVIGVIAAWSSACIPNVQRPDVHLVGARLGGLGLQGGTLFVQLSVVNPNGFALRASGLTYRVELREPGEASENWSELVEGVFGREVQVAAQDSAIVEIPVEFRYAGVGSALRSLLDTGTLNYRLSGDVAVEHPIRTRIPYRHTGMTNLVRID